jgi:aminoglycoside N3'-acetyltransferase
VKPTVETVLEQLKALGVRQGDILFITADLLQVGLFFKSRTATMAAWVDLLTKAVGEQGTIIVAAYTPVFFRMKRDRRVVFSAEVPSTAGALSNALLGDLSRYLRKPRFLGPCSSIETQSIILTTVTS